MASLIRTFDTIQLRLNGNGRKWHVKNLIGFQLRDIEQTALQKVGLYLQRSKHGDITTDIQKSHEAGITPWREHISTTYRQTMRLQRDYHVIMNIAAYLVDYQQAYLCSNNWMDLRKLTYGRIASTIPDVSEPTVRRKIKLLMFSYNNRMVPADTLVCANQLPYICKHLAYLQCEHPKSGRSALLERLRQDGYILSDGQLGIAMRLLGKIKIRSILAEFENIE